MDGFATDGTILNARNLIGMSVGPGDDFHSLCGDELFPVVYRALFHVFSWIILVRIGGNLPHVPTRVFDFDRGATVFFNRIEDGGVVGGAGGGEAHDRALQGAIVGEVHVPEMFFD